MSFKAVELQHALPKSQDIGKLQDYIHSKANIEQSILMSQTKQLDMKKRKKTEKLSKSQLMEQNTLKKPKAKEPFKGTIIDIEL